MLAQIFEFIGNHPFLVSLFAFLLVAFIIHERRQGGASVSPGSLVKLMNHEGAAIIDVRDSTEFNKGHITGALNFPYATLDSRVEELESYKEQPVVLVCKMGQHAGAVGRKLRARGFADVRRLSGGMAEWSSSNLPVIR